MAGLIALKMLSTLLNCLPLSEANLTLSFKLETLHEEQEYVTIF